MTDAMKNMLFGAAMALAGAVVGGIIVGAGIKSETRQAVSGQPSAFSGQKLAVSGQRPVNFSPSILPVGGTNLRLGPIGRTNIHLLTSVATNGIKRLVASAPAGAMSFTTFQQVQNMPEVKLAKDEFMQAQSRYINTIRSALENPANAAKIRESLPPGTPLTVTSAPRSATTNRVQQRTTATGQPPQ